MKRVMGIQIHHQSTNHWPSWCPASTKPPEWGMVSDQLKDAVKCLSDTFEAKGCARSDRIQNAMPVPTPQMTPRPAATPQTGSQEARFLWRNPMMRPTRAAWKEWPAVGDAADGDGEEDRSRRRPRPRLGVAV